MLTKYTLSLAALTVLSSSAFALDESIHPRGFWLEMNNNTSFLNVGYKLEFCKLPHHEGAAEGNHCFTVIYYCDDEGTPIFFDGDDFPHFHDVYLKEVIVFDIYTSDDETGAKISTPDVTIEFDEPAPNCVLDLSSIAKLEYDALSEVGKEALVIGYNALDITFFETGGTLGLICDQFVAFDA